jgi:hypothetical protein
MVALRVSSMAYLDVPSCLRQNHPPCHPEAVGDTGVLSKQVLDWRALSPTTARHRFDRPRTHSVFAKKCRLFANIAPFYPKQYTLPFSVCFGVALFSWSRQRRQVAEVLLAVCANRPCLSHTSVLNSVLRFPGFDGTAAFEARFFQCRLCSRFPSVFPARFSPVLSLAKRQKQLFLNSRIWHWHSAYKHGGFPPRHPADKPHSSNIDVAARMRPVSCCCLLICVNAQTNISGHSYDQNRKKRGCEKPRAKHRIWFFPSATRFLFLLIYDFLSQMSPQHGHCNTHCTKS